jgi:hypothetical protein
MIIQEFTRIIRQALHNVGWEGGLRVERDTTNLGVGGDPGNTAHTFMTWNRVGKGNRNREFSDMTLTESWQDEGEAVSAYRKSVKHGAAPVWAGCDEANDPDGAPGALIAREFDIFATGPVDDSRVRVACDIVGGDEAFKQRGENSGAQGTYGWHVYATDSTPWFRWLYAGFADFYLRSGIRLFGRKLGSWTPERAIDIRGEHVVGVDFSNGNFQSVMRVRQGQEYSLDEYDDFRFSRQGNEVVFTKHTAQGRKTVFSMNMETGDLCAKRFVTIQ